MTDLYAEALSTFATLFGEAKTAGTEVEPNAMTLATATPDGHPSARTVLLKAFDAEGRAIGLAEASLRHDYVNGTEGSPVGFLEGWYVDPAWQGRGVGRALVAAVEAWTRGQGCTELASDASLDNTGSHAAHAACGFEETERVVYFRKRLDA